ncbi:antibiotic biosynthesis monooxygenase [Salipiger mangrovisoli]|uniref:Antibiotic biosynthesis monooxygenase n=1 Tax=Salipiger mangrovisoli TaxID=2865933 RepID=A0ABR9XC53_9RHOB|nr:antibiotic biosynthesis monooxygenase [Salipiger mangrovisoli]
MYKFILTIDCQPGTRDRILAQAPEAQAATRAEPGCIAYDFYTCTDNPDRLVFVESWKDEDAHAFHMRQAHTQRFIAHHEQFHDRLTFETINVAST